MKCGFTRNLCKYLLKFSVSLFVYDVKPIFFKALPDGLHGYTTPSGLKTGDRFQRERPQLFEKSFSLHPYD